MELIYEDARGERFVNSAIADRGEFWWDTTRPDAPVLWDSTIQLGEQFFNEVIAHPIPLDLNILRSLKRSALGLDLYLWLTYRTFALKRPLRLSWKQLYRQFGADPANAWKHSTVKSFRVGVSARAEKKSPRAWPGLHYQTVTGGLVVSPSPPRIAPAQLHLISE